MKQHTPTMAVEANCACIEHLPVQSHSRLPAIQQCSAPLSISSPGKVSSAHLSSTSSRVGSYRSRSAPPWQMRRTDVADATKKMASTTLSTTLCVKLPTTAISKKHVLFRQGEFSDAIFYIASGSVHRVVNTENGNERLVAILGPDDFCGEECLTAQPWHSTSAVAVEEARIVRIEKATMLRLLHDSAAFSDVFTTFLLARNLKTEGALIDQLVGSVEQRLRRALLALAKVRESDVGTGIIHNAKQEMLAALVGTTRPRVNHLLNKFRDLGLIEYGRGIPAGEIHVLAALQQIDERNSQ